MDVFLVDDNPADLVLLQEMLRTCRILNPVKCMGSAEECIAALELERCKLAWGGTLVFLDLLMTGKGGLWVLKEARKRKLLNDVLFVMLSGITDLKSVSQGYQLGAKTFLIKPIGFRDVLDAIEALEPKMGMDSCPEGYHLRLRREPGGAIWGTPQTDNAMRQDQGRNERARKNS